MRIIAGKLRRRPIRAPKGFVTRPSTDRTREALFNLVESRLDLADARVLDLYAGSGALGLEAISRGAREAVFVESNPRILSVARENAESLGVSDACRFVRNDASRFVATFRGEPFDLILADPPYEDPNVRSWPGAALPLLSNEGLFVLEHDVRHDFENYAALNVSRAYGRTVVTIFAKVP